MLQGWKTRRSRAGGNLEPVQVVGCVGAITGVWAGNSLRSEQLRSWVEFRVDESQRRGKRHSGAGRKPARLTVLTGQAGQGFLDTGFRRYDGAGRQGNPTDSELLLKDKRVSNVENPDCRRCGQGSCERGRLVRCPYSVVTESSLPSMAALRVCQASTAHLMRVG